MKFSEDILQEIENDSKILLEELSLYNEDQEMKNPNIPDKTNQDMKKKSILNKSNALLKKMKSNVNNEEYLLKGFDYHSKILYNIATKVPFVGKIIAVPLMAVTKAAVNNLPPLAKIEQNKILNLYTSFQGDRAAVNAKIEKLEKLKKLTKEQNEELVLLKKMSAELDMNLKRLEFNYKLSHIEQKQARMSNSMRKKNYKF